MPQRYMDDFTPGEIFKSAPHRLSDAHFTAFAVLTGDAHPLHYDADYARAKGWDGPLAHGLMLLGLSALGAGGLVISAAVASKWCSKAPMC